MRVTIHTHTHTSNRSPSIPLDLEEDEEKGEEEKGRKKERKKYSPLVGIRGRAELAQHAVQIGRQGIKQLKEKQKGLEWWKHTPRFRSVYINRLLFFNERTLRHSYRETYFTFSMKIRTNPINNAS